MSGASADAADEASAPAVAAASTVPAAADFPRAERASGYGAAKRPVACVVLGMAGSGKTTLMQRLNAYLHVQQTPYYLINLDPAVLDTPFGANIDIRDTVNYKEVMKQYHLGPNGGILTALNLFATRFDEVLKLVEARAGSVKYLLLDTPGQIEIFTWSASGAVITESLASVLPTVILYVIDTPRSSNAVTFMSNMLYACSILYKTKLPLLLVFNKIDVKSCDFAMRWMQDLDSFQEALQEERSYVGTLATSLALMLEEFYANLSLVGVSALTGDGMQELFKAIDTCGVEFETTCAKSRTERSRKHALRKLFIAIECPYCGRLTALVDAMCADVHRYAVELELRQAKLQEAEFKRRRDAARGLTVDREDEDGYPLDAPGAQVVFDGRGDLFALGGEEEEEDQDGQYTGDDEESQRGQAADNREKYESLQRCLQAQQKRREGGK